MIGVVLATGLSIGWMAWGWKWPLIEQVRGIAIHFLMSVGLVCLWLQVLIAKHVVRDIIALRRQIKDLQRYEESRILSLNELLNRLEMLMTILRRKRRPAHVIFLDLNVPDFALKTVADEVGRLCLSGVRQNYDLVGRLSERTIAVVLYDADEQVAGIVRQRIQRKMQN